MVIELPLHIFLIEGKIYPSYIVSPLFFVCVFLNHLSAKSTIFLCQPRLLQPWVSLLISSIDMALTLGD